MALVIYFSQSRAGISENPLLYQFNKRVHKGTCCQSQHVRECKGVSQ